MVLFPCALLVQQTNEILVIYSWIIETDYFDNYYADCVSIEFRSVQQTIQKYRLFMHKSTLINFAEVFAFVVSCKRLHVMAVVIYKSVIHFAELVIDFETQIFIDDLVYGKHNSMDCFVGAHVQSLPKVVDSEIKMLLVKAKELENQYFAIHNKI